MTEFIIECSRCADGDPGHGEDCLVAFIIGLDAAEPAPILFDDVEARAVRALRDGGLLPAGLRLPSDPLGATGS